MKLLIVDDSKAMRMIVKRTLKQAGFGSHEFVEAENGIDALEKIESEKPNVVLSDWNMPELNGIGLLKKLRESGDKTPLGFVTSESTPEIHREAIDEGASFLITKPFTAESFENNLTPIMK